jgi:hypothetical protein
MKKYGRTETRNKGVTVERGHNRPTNYPTTSKNQDEDYDEVSLSNHSHGLAYLLSSGFKYRPQASVLKYDGI